MDRRRRNHKGCLKKRCVVRPICREVNPVPRRMEKDGCCSRRAHRDHRIVPIFTRWGATDPRQPCSQTMLLYPGCRTVKFHYPFCKTYGGNKILEDTPVTANDITEITINIIFNLIKNSISKALKLQMLTVPGGSQMKPYRCVILWSYICIIGNECWLHLGFLLLFNQGGMWT